MRFRFSLTDYTINPAGVTTVLPDEPEGWREAIIRAKRDEKTHGFLFEYTLNRLGFHGTGASIITTAYNSKGANANTEVYIEIGCDDDDTFEEFYTGKLIYPDIKFINEDFCLIEIPVEQIGCIQTFKNRMDHKVDLLSATSFDGTALQTYQALPEIIPLPTKDILFKTDFEMEPGHTETFTSPVMLTGQSHAYVKSFTWDVVNKDEFPVSTSMAFEYFEESSGTSPARNFFGASAAIIEVQESSIFCTPTTGLFRIAMNGSFSLSTTETRTFTWGIFFLHSDIEGNFISSTTLASGTSTGTQPFVASFDFDESIIRGVSHGDRIDVYFIISNFQNTTGSGGSSNPFDLEIELNSASFTAESYNVCDEVEADVFLVHEALSRVAEIISDDCLRVYSEYFGRIDSEPFYYDQDGCAGLTAITNGLFIRRALRTDGSENKLFISFKELYDGLNAIHNIGLGIEDMQGYGGGQVLRIEPFDYFYQSGTVLSIVNPKKFERRMDERRLYSKVNFGYKKWESEYRGSLDEFLTTREYRTELEAVEKALNIESNLIASNYAWEVTKRIGPNSEDWRYDNDHFVLCLERYYSGYIADNFFPASSANVLTFNYFNQRISPIRNLLRWYKAIRTKSSERFKFNSGTANYIAEWRKTTLDDCVLEQQNTLIAENENISPNTFKDSAEALPILQGEVIEVEYPLSWQDWKLFKASPYKQVTLTKDGVTFTTWGDVIEYRPAEGIAKFVLLPEWA